MTKLQKLYKEFKAAEMKYRAHLAEVQFSRGDCAVSLVRESYIKPHYRRAYTRRKVKV